MNICVLRSCRGGGGGCAGGGGALAGVCEAPRAPRPVQRGSPGSPACAVCRSRALRSPGNSSRPTSCPLGPGVLQLARPIGGAGAEGQPARAPDVTSSSRALQPGSPLSTRKAVNTRPCMHCIEGSSGPRDPKAPCDPGSVQAQPPGQASPTAARSSPSQPENSHTGAGRPSPAEPRLGGQGRRRRPPRRTLATLDQPCRAPREQLRGCSSVRL